MPPPNRLRLPEGPDAVSPECRRRPRALTGRRAVRVTETGQEGEGAIPYPRRETESSLMDFTWKSMSLSSEVLTQ